MEMGDLLYTFTGHSSSVNSATFSPDGTKVVSGSSDKTVKVWEADTGNLITTFTDHSSTVNSATFSPDGTKVVSGSSDKTVKVWEADTGNVVTTFTGHSRHVNSATFSSDGTKVVSGSDDKTAKVVNLMDARVELFIDSTEDGVPELVLTNEAVLGNIRYAENSNIYKCKFYNATAVPIENVLISVSSEPAGVDVTMSKTRDPFSAAQSLTFTGPYSENGGEDFFYIRIESTTSADEGPVSVNLNIDADNYVE